MIEQKEGRKKGVNQSVHIINLITVNSTVKTLILV